MSEDHKSAMDSVLQLNEELRKENSSLSDVLKNKSVNLAEL